MSSHPQPDSGRPRLVVVLVCRCRRWWLIVEREGAEGWELGGLQREWVKEIRERERESAGIKV